MEFPPIFKLHRLFPSKTNHSQARECGQMIPKKTLIDDQHSFNKAMWPGGVTSEPFNVAPKARGKRVGNKEYVSIKQSLKPKPAKNKKTSVRKQKRISSYFTRSNPTSLTNEQLTEMVIQLQTGMKQLTN
ncbi:hypothetical protein YC2023_011373 [Brassica napus]